MRYRFVKENRSSFPVVKMCQILGVSQSGFYRWNNAPLSRRKKESRLLRQRVFELYKEHKGMAGSPMITADLRAEPEFPKVSKNRVARHMRDMGLRCKTNKKYIVTTDSKHSNPIAPNLLNREFTVSSPDTVWVGDITYLRVGAKWHYLSVFIDLFSRIVVGWDLMCIPRHPASHSIRSRPVIPRDRGHPFQ
jgi:putative transposase